MNERQRELFNAQRLRKGLTAQLERMHKKASPRLIPRVLVVQYLSRQFSVTEACARRNLVKAANEGVVVELRPERNWRVPFPETYNFPPVYAVPDGSYYRLERGPSATGGPRQLSFVLTARDFDVLRHKLCEQLGGSFEPVRQPGPYVPGAPQQLSAELYEELVAAVRLARLRGNAETVTKAVLGPLNLLPPAR